MPAARLLGLAGLAGLAGLLASAAGAAPALDADAAWGGASRPGRMTELRLRLESPVEGAVALSIDAGSARVEGVAPLRAAVPRLLHLTVPAAAGYDLRAGDADGAAARHVTAQFTDLPLAALGVAGVGPWPDTLARADVGADAFPTKAAGFDAVDALAIDGATLTQLSPAQREALLAYVAGCGRLALVGVPEDVGALFTRAAGCRAAALRRLEDPRDVPAAIAALLEQTLPEPPAFGDLHALAPPDAGPWQAVLGVLGVYGLGLLVVAARAHRARTAILYASATAVTVALAQSALPTAPRSLALAQGEDGRPGLRYAVLREATGRARGQLVEPLAGPLGAPWPCDPGATGTPAPSAAAPPPLRLRLAADGQGYVAGERARALFSVAATCWRGTRPYARIARVERTGDGAYVVGNGDPAAWPPGVALIDGQAYRLPALASGARATLAQRVEPPPAAALVRGEDDRATLLWPLAPALLGLESASARAVLAWRVPVSVTGP